MRTVKLGSLSKTILEPLQDLLVQVASLKDKPKEEKGEEATKAEEEKEKEKEKEKKPSEAEKMSKQAR